MPVVSSRRRSLMPSQKAPEGEPGVAIGILERKLGSMALKLIGGFGLEDEALVDPACSRGWWGRGSC